MRGRTASRSVGALASAAALALAIVGAGQADPSGPQAFFFGVDCTGLGSVILSNSGPSHAAALQVVGSATVVLVAKNRALEERANSAGTTCIFKSGGSDPNDLEPIDEPEVVPVVIIDG